jgi:hypothetical protein
MFVNKLNERFDRRGIRSREMKELRIGQKGPTEESFQYFSFISYKRTDSRIARWLHKKLNWYRFPKKIVEPVNRLIRCKYSNAFYLPCFYKKGLNNIYNQLLA